MALLWKLDPLSTKTISFKTEKSTQKVENEPSYVENGPKTIACKCEKSALEM